jgi:hypothetical protein
MYLSHSRTASLVRLFFVSFACVILFSIGVRTAWSQSLNWEGQTGVFVTPLAYTVPSPERSVARPIVAYHYLNGGPVLGRFHQASVTSGAFERIEFGYTRDFQQSGNTAGLSELWSGGFNIVHAKALLVSETRTCVPHSLQVLLCAARCRMLGV